MKIILKENIENLGNKGDIVNVAAGYGRNYLLPKKLALAVTSTNMKMIEMEQASLKKNLEKARITYQDVIQKLNAVSLSFERKAGEKNTIFGSVSVADIKEALDKQSFEIEKKKILLKEPIKRLGDYTVSIRVFLDDIAEIKIQVVPEGGEKEVVKPVEDKVKTEPKTKKAIVETAPPEVIPEAASPEPEEAPKEEIRSSESKEETDKPKKKKGKEAVKENVAKEEPVGETPEEKEPEVAVTPKDKEVVEEKVETKPEVVKEEVVIVAASNEKTHEDEEKDKSFEKSKTSK